MKKSFILCALISSLLLGAMEPQGGATKIGDEMLKAEKAKRADRKLRDLIRRKYYDNVEQAKTEDGGILAYNYFQQLKQQALVPGFLFNDTYYYLSDYAREDAETCSIIKRYSNAVIQQAFFLHEQKPVDSSNELQHAYESVSRDSNQLSFIITGKKENELTLEEARQRLRLIAEKISNTEPLPALVLEHE